MEAMAEIGAAEPGPPCPLEIPQQTLGSDGIAVIERVQIEEAAVDGALGRALGGIEGDEQGQVAGQMLEGNVLTPRLVGGSVGLHPVWLLLALSVFGALFGFVGLLVAVPVAVAPRLSVTWNPIM